MNTGRRVALVALLFVYGVVRLYWWYDALYWWRNVAPLNSPAAAGAFKVLVWVVPSLIVVAAIHRIGLSRSLRYVGLDAHVLRGLAFGLIATTPLALAVLVTGYKRIDPAILVGTALIGPFAEEVLFRGFLLRELHAHARWPIGWAIAGSALAFGSAHVPDLDMKIVGTFVEFTTSDPGLAVRRLALMSTEVGMMAAGGAVFAWAFYRSGSLWPAVALHGGLNLWLTLAHGDARPGSDLTLDLVAIAQLMTMAAALLLTLRWRPTPAAARSLQPS